MAGTVQVRADQFRGARSVFVRRAMTGALPQAESQKQQSHEPSGHDGSRGDDFIEPFGLSAVKSLDVAGMFKFCGRIVKNP